MIANENIQDKENKRIVIADDHQLVAEGLKDLLEQQPSWQVCAIAANGREALSLVYKHSPHLLITDLNMPDQDGFELLEVMKSRFPSVKIIVISMYSAAAIVKRVLETGVDAYLMKEQSSEEVLLAVTKVLAGENYVNSEFSLKKPAKEEFRDDFKLKISLTERETSILRLIAQSYSNKEIGEKLFISEFTVQTHRRNLKRKLKAEKTADLVRFAYDNQLI